MRKQLVYHICTSRHIPTPQRQLATAEWTSYSVAVINEAFRIHPAVGLILERYVPSGGETISGFHLPEGTIVGINAWVLHQNKEIFGEDAQRFRPERWIESSPEQLKEMRRNLFTVSKRMRCQAHVHSPADMSHHRSSLVPVHGPALAKTSPCSRSTNSC